MRVTGVVLAAIGTAGPDESWRGTEKIGLRSDRCGSHFIDVASVEKTAILVVPQPGSCQKPFTVHRVVGFVRLDVNDRRLSLSKPLYEPVVNTIVILVDDDA